MKKTRMVLVAAITAMSLIAFGCSDISTFEEDSLAEPEKVLASRSASITNVTYTKANEICTLVFEGYNWGEKGPICVTKGTMKNGFSKKTVYLITLSGTEDVKKQSTGYMTDLLSGFNLKNAYYDNVVKVISENIPSGANLILSGHSLGGMICQQVAACDSIKKNYNVLNTVTFGSPLLSAGSREGTTKRLGDTSDVIPYASGSLFNNTLWAVMGLNREDGGYKFASTEAHTESYLREDVWGDYDVLGSKYGSATITLDLNTKQFYQSPSYLW